MKRDDETLLEYLIRIAKEKGEGLGEGLQQLGVDRLREARPDAARRQGLMPDQLDIVEDTEVPFPPDRPPVFMPEDITSLMSTQDPAPDRASLEAMITQAGERRPFEEPQPLQEWTGVGPAPEADPALMQRMLTQPSQTDIAREQWTGVGPLPGEAKSLMDLDQSMTGMREQPAQQDLPSPLTSRMPTANLTSEVAPNPTSGQALAEQRAHMKETGASREEAYEWWMGKEGGEVKEYEPGRIAKGFGKDVARYKKFWDDNKSWLNTPIGIMIDNALNPEKEIGVDAVSKTRSQMSKALGKKDTTTKVPTKEQAKKSVDKASKKTGQGSPSFDGHSSKAEFFKSMGLSLEGNKFAERMDKIDSEAGMFDMIAMLGGAGNSRAGTNFRNKSYQRLRTEMQMDQRDWDRAYQMFSHPWDTWFDEKGLRDPIARLRGTGPPPGGGWAKTRPPKDPQLTTPTRLIEEIKSLYTGEESLDEIMLRFAQADPNFALNPEGAMEGAAISAQIYLGLNFVPWTRVEKQQVRRLMAEGKVNDVVKWIEEKSLDPNDWYVPYDMIDEVNAWWEENGDKWTGRLINGN